MVNVVTMINIRTKHKKIFSASIANTFWKRLVGLLGQKALPEHTGLILERCNCVHTIGMKFPIDVIFLNEERSVLSITTNLKPCRIARCRGATTVLECNSGEAEIHDIELGQKLYWK